MAEKDAKTLLTPDQYWELEQKKLELENKKLENELTIKQMEITSAEKIATENNKVAAEANKVGLWTNLINGIKIAVYLIVALIGFVFSWRWFCETEAFEMQGHLSPHASKWSDKMFEWAVKRIEALKN